MKSMILRAGAALGAAALAAGALAAQTAPAEETEATQTEQPATKSDPKPGTGTTADTAEAKGEEERICRYIKLDISSRRKTKVCRTTQEWVELGNPR